MSIDITKERVTRIFKYLEALYQHRNPVKRQISEQPWVLWLDSLTDHPNIKFSRSYSIEEQKSSIIKVKRPQVSVAPEPPHDLRNWIKNGWQDPFKEVEILESINLPSGEDTITIFFIDDKERIEQVAEWTCRRNVWAAAECPAREVMKVYERIYDLYVLLQKESEKYQIVLGDGILNWRQPEGGIHHPILLQKLELEFDSANTEFSFEETNDAPELYSALFASLEDIDGKLLAYHRDDIENKNYSPLGEEATDSFFKRFISQLSVHGEFIMKDNVEGELDSPRIFRRPCIFLQDRSGGLLVTIQSIIEHIQQNTELPGSLQSIVGISQPNKEELSAQSSQLQYHEPDNIYFGKPANIEQIKVAEVLDHNFGVLVQGPPGTGKTHTIANLLGHLLTQGKTVLVTSHTTKALRVLREKVAKELQPLCVSVLDRDSQSQEEMKNSIESIVSELSTINENEYIRKTDDLQTRRDWIIKRIEDLQKNLIDGRSIEFQSIVIAGKEYSPKDAIQIVLSGRNRNDWIPGTIEPFSPVPLSIEECNKLYEYTYTLSTENVLVIASALPSLECLPVEDDVALWMEQERELLHMDYRTGEEYWNDIPPDFEDGYYLKLHELNQTLSSAVEEIGEVSDWHKAILQAGWKGKAHRQVWDQLVSDADQYVTKHALFKTQIYKYQPLFTTKLEFHQHMNVVNEIIAHLESGGTLGRLTLIIHPSWSTFRKNVTINNKMISTLDEFQFIREYMILQQERLDLIQRWNGCMSDCRGLLLQSEENIEEILPQIYPVILQRLNWYDQIWRNHQEKLIEMGLSWELLLTKQPMVTGQSAEFIRLFQTICGPLKECLTSRSNRYRLEEIQRSLSKVEAYIDCYCHSKYADIAIALRTAIRNRDVPEYRHAIANLHHTIAMSEVVLQRQVLLDKLAVYAQEWATQMQEFNEKHVASQPPGNVEDAWLWKQLHQELSARASLSLDKIEEELDLLTTDLYTITNQFISNRAWLHQKRRVKLNQQQALVGYLDVTKRIGRGTGKRVPELQKEARRLMSECRSAVPVWIMPLTRVAETFSPTQTQFDVVIIDEASQCDLMGLLALYLGKKVVVVGDHEQVSPLSVGQNSTIIDSLISQFLQGIPNAILYDGKASIYDLARQSFGGILCLTEHFRCVPEIIHFSNKLCYNMGLKPLRESNSSYLKPATISYRVTGASKDGKINEQEAITIVSLIVAACKLPVYKNKTIGVITLLRDEQALLIDQHLRKHLTDDEYTKRHIICGNPAHFQGDERDVIFLSLVDSTDNPPLAMRADGPDGMYKKRYNVAASRACEQMWVVHSLDVNIDLKPGDIRRELIEHVENPFRAERELESLANATESPFEEEVLKNLVHKGYTVVPQWKVGYYRIDMVATCGDKKVAIECDGEKYHSLDKLAEDMARQAILERLGWRFIRIRGSQYYLDPEKTMEAVLVRLNELEVFPNHVEKEADISQDSEIVQRVIRDADLLRITWSGDGGASPIEVIEPIEPRVIPEAAPAKELMATKVSEGLMLLLTSGKQDNEQWIRTQGHKNWDRLAAWGAENGKLNAKYILFAQRLSKRVMNVSEITFYQAAKGRQMMEKCILQGFEFWSTKYI
jgi:very-short-patch-repair endonuclease